MRISPALLGTSFVSIYILASPVLANSSRDKAIEACRLHPMCSVFEVTETCKGNAKCMTELTEKRTKKSAKFVNDVNDKAKKGINNAADKASKGVKKLFKKKRSS